MTGPSVQFIHVGDKLSARRLAYRHLHGHGTCIVWLGGFRSDMLSTKALALEDWARGQDRQFLRFDYSGHGESESARAGERFIDGTISRWLEDALAILAMVDAPLLLVGSSMGGWIALLAAQALKKTARLQAMVLIAPAVDFTESLMWPQFSPEIRAEILENGVWYRPSSYFDTPMPITRALIEDGRRHLLLGAMIDPGCPVHVLQGQQDPDVPWPHATRLLEHLPATQATLTLVRDGDHRLSRPQDIALLVETVARAANAGQIRPDQDLP